MEQRLVVVRIKYIYTCPSKTKCVFYCLVIASEIQKVCCGFETDCRVSYLERTAYISKIHFDSTRTNKNFRHKVRRNCKIQTLVFNNKIYLNVSFQEHSEQFTIVQQIFQEFLHFFRACGLRLVHYVIYINQYRP